MKPSLTQSKIIEQLRENTGIHMLDSGMGSGRHWQQNKNRDFIHEPASILKFDLDYDYDSEPTDSWSLDYRESLFWYMSDKLTYNSDLNRQFTRFSNRVDEKENDWFETLKHFMDKLKSKGLWDGKAEVEYTYGRDNNLDQNFQAYEFDYEHPEYSKHGGMMVVVMTHNGADARGGFSKPKFYYEDNEGFLYPDTDIYIRCEKEITLAPDLFGGESEILKSGTKDVDGEHIWTYYGGYSPGFECDNPNTESLSNFEATTDESLRGQGFIYVDADGHGYCPYCGEKLI